MTIYTLDEIKEVFQDCNLYVVTNEKWAPPEDLTEAQIIADGYEGSTPYTRPVHSMVNESIVSLMQSGDIQILTPPLEIENSQEDPLWKTSDYKGPALKLRLS